MAVLPSAVLDASALASRLQAGSAALLPTDTLPALAASPVHAAQLWTMKQRSADKPLILMGATPEELLAHVSPLAMEDAWSMARRYWPGPSPWLYRLRVCLLRLLILELSRLGCEYRIVK